MMYMEKNGEEEPPQPSGSGSNSQDSGKGGKHPDDPAGPTGKAKEGAPSAEGEDTVGKGKRAQKGKKKKGKKTKADNKDDEEGDGGLWRPRGWCFHSVFLHQYKEKIAERTDKLSGAPRGSGPWLGRYQGAAKGIKEKLSKDKIKELTAVQECWNEKGPDEETQAE